MVNAAVGADRDPGALDLLGHAAAAACGRSRPIEEAHLPPPPKSLEALPPLMLVGAVVGEGDAIAILVNLTDQKVVRMRQGEALGGCSLTSVQPREVTFRQGDRSEVLVLQRSNGKTAPRDRLQRRRRRPTAAAS